MKSIIRFIQKQFGKYSPDYEYFIKLSDIHIQPEFAATRICKNKYIRKWQFYRKNGHCESRIILDKNFTLIDGYSSYIILQISEGMDAKVPIYFKN